MAVELEWCRMTLGELSLNSSSFPQINYHSTWISALKLTKPEGFSTGTQIVPVRSVPRGSNPATPISHADPRTT